MSARNIIESVEKLIKLHKSFNQLALRKTTILKASDTEAITALLIEEQKHIKAISQTDKEREAKSRGIFYSKRSSETDCFHRHSNGINRTN